MKSSLRNFWLYAMGRLVSLVGSGIQSLALSLYILDITGSGTMMGTFLIMSMLPVIILAPIAGVVGDRFNRKAIMIYMDFARGALIFFLAFLAYRNMLTLPVIYISQFAMAIMDTFFGPATSAMLPDIVPKEQLTRANSILGAINNLSYIVGPAMGGVLYPLGMGVVLILNATSFVVSGISEIFIQYKQTTERKKMSVGQFFEDLKDGFAFLKVRSDVFTVMIFLMIVDFLFIPSFIVVFPYFARTVVRFNSQQYGILNSCWIIGNLIGNLLIASFFAKRNPGRLFKFGLFGQMVPVYIFNILIFPWGVKFFGGVTWLYFVAIALPLIATGLLNAFVGTPIRVFFQKAIPTKVRSRVFSVLAVMSRLVLPLGTATYGFLVDHVPAHYLVLTALSLSLAVSVAFVVTGKLNVISGEASYA